MANPRQSHSIPLTPLVPQHQLNIVFESVQLRGMTSPERATVLMLLTELLMQAAGVQTEDADHDAR